MKASARRSPSKERSPRLTHLDAAGQAAMVNVSNKPPMRRKAIAAGEVHLRPATLRLIRRNQIGKGDVLSVARIAGIQAAKRTGELIPLCHPLGLSHVAVDFEFPQSGNRICITSTAEIVAPTGVEMEALTAVAVAALTLYDMCKAVDKSMVIGRIRLVSKVKLPID